MILTQVETASITSLPRYLLTTLSIPVLLRFPLTGLFPGFDLNLTLRGLDLDLVLCLL